MPCVTPAYLDLGNKLVSRMHTACIATTYRQNLCFSSHCFVGVYSIIYMQQSYQPDADVDVCTVQVSIQLGPGC